MLRRICIVLICLAASWASNVNPLAAQPGENPAKTEKMVRVTYPIADLIVPIEDHTAFGERQPDKDGRGITKDTMAMELVKRITESVAKETWESAGGKASIQYFPIGLAIVVQQREDVHKEIARLLAELRRLQDVQVSMELRLLIGVSPPMAKQIRAAMDAEGQPVRAWNIEKPAYVGRFVSVDDKQMRAILESAQTDRAAHIMQPPKLTIYNGQQACINSMVAGVGMRCDVWPIAAADRKSVRFSLHLEYAAAHGKKARPAVTEVIGTFAVPADHSLVWRVGESLFVVATPRVVIVEEEENVFFGGILKISGVDGAVWRAIPEPVRAAEASLPQREKSCNETDQLIARQVVKDGFLFLEVGELAKAEFIAQKAKELGASFGPGERTPDDLLSEIQRRRRGSGGEEQSIPEPRKPANQPSPKERAIQYRLKQPISLNFKDTPLREAIKCIAIQSGIQVVPDMRALQEARVNMDAPVSGSADNINMKSALNILFRPMRLQWIIEDEVLKITTEGRINRPFQKNYKVADLVVPLPTIVGQEPGKTAEGELMELIRTTVAKDSWEDMGGPGSLQYFPAEKTLVVTQSQEIHEEVELCLATLRKLQDRMVNVEVRFIHSSAEASQRLLTEMGGRDAVRFAAMDDAGARRFLDIAKGQTVVAAPKINVCDGQRLAMQCLQKQVALTEFCAQVSEPIVVAAVRSQPNCRSDVLGQKPATLSRKEKTIGGWRYHVQPAISPDRRSVRLNLTVENFVNDDAIEHTTKATGTFTVENQRTLVWHLGPTAGGEHLFVLVTPRVIVRQQEEDDSPADLPPIPGR